MKSLNDEIYQPIIIKCRKCVNRVIGRTALDNQILILENGLIALNYFCWQCPCGKNDSWLAPLLPDDAPTIDNTVPDIQSIAHRSAALKKKMKKFGYTAKNKNADYQSQNQTAATDF